MKTFKKIYLTIILLSFYIFGQENILKKDSIIESIPLKMESVRSIEIDDLNQKYKHLNYDDSNNFSDYIIAFIYKHLNIIDTIVNYDFKEDFIYIVIFLTSLLFIVYRIAKHKGAWFWQKSNKSFNSSLSSKEENIQHNDFQNLIDKNEQKNNFRLCIRLYYLWLLKILNQENHIQWSIKKTNSDYLREIKNPIIKTDFQQFSYFYNYIWYGEFKIDKQQYLQIKSQFENYINSKK